MKCSVMLRVALPVARASALEVVMELLLKAATDRKVAKSVEVLEAAEGEGGKAAENTAWISARKTRSRYMLLMLSELAELRC